MRETVRQLTQEGGFNAHILVGRLELRDGAGVLV
jgi:hypothetical protein